MPKLTDSGNKDQEIVFTSNAECDHCQAIQDVAFPTGKMDEDGLTDLDPGELVETVICVACSGEFVAAYAGWIQYGDA